MLRGTGAGRDDHRARFERIAIDDELERLAGEIDAVEIAEFDPRAETLGLLLQLLHQLEAIDALGKAGEILDDAGGGEQAARLAAGEDERREIGARGVDRGGEAGATGADDDDLFHGSNKHATGLALVELLRRAAANFNRKQEIMKTDKKGG